MSFYTRVFNAIPLSFARVAPLKAEFDRIAQGFTAAADKYDGPAADVVAAREGQASLLASLGRYLSTLRPATGSVDMGGHRLRNVAAPELGGDVATRDYVQGAIMAPALPGAAEHRGKIARAMESGLPGWSDVWGPATVATDGMTLQARTYYTVDCSAGPVSLIMPAAPALGDWLRIRDIKGKAAQNNITLSRNGSKFMWLEEDYIMDVSGEVLLPEFTSEGWVR